MATQWWNPFDGDIIPGINVGNAFKQVTTGKDYDIIDGVTNSNRPGQLQINGNYDVGVRPVSTGGGGGTGNGTGGGSTQVQGSSTPAPSGVAALPALNQAAINNTRIAIDQLPALLQAALAAEATRYGNTTRGFDTQQQQQQGQYDTSTTTNQQNYDANYMDSIRAGVKGLGNLFNLLRGTGAGGGTAQEQAQDLVGGVTAQDIRTGADTQKANQTSLDAALSTFLTDLRGKRDAAADTFENNKRAINRDNQTQLQDLYGKMAGYYFDGGRTAQATDFMNKAGSLTPGIAANSQSRQSAYDTTPVAVQAPTLSAFEAPSQPDVVSTPNNGQVGSGIFTMNRKKEQQDLALPVGA